MREVFQQSLNEVRLQLVEISGLVAEAIDQATSSFETGNVTLAETVISNDPVIDQKTVALDELAIDILARQAPVAGDLRMVVSALRMSASLERMGDIAEHIAQLARMRFPDRAVPEELRPTFTHMGQIDVALAKKVTLLLDTRDIELADEIVASDDELDKLHAGVFGTVSNWDEASATTIDVTLASRYHERFGDHAVSVAKKMVYLATGDWDTHQ